MLDKALLTILLTSAKWLYWDQKQSVVYLVGSCSYKKISSKKIMIMPKISNSIKSQINRAKEGLRDVETMYN